MDLPYDGSIDLYLGSMFSGKTSQLRMKLCTYRWVYGKDQVLCIKFSEDTRYDSEKILTHNGDSITDNMIKCNKLAAIKSKAMQFKCIGIDDGQFFPDIVEFCEDMANNGKVVIVAALDGKWSRTEWDSNRLIPKCEFVVKLPSVCKMCKSTKGAFSTKYKEDGRDIDYGTDDKYCAVCRKCYFLHKKLNKKNEF